MGNKKSQKNSQIHLWQPQKNGPFPQFFFAQNSNVIINIVAIFASFNLIWNPDLYASNFWKEKNDLSIVINFRFNQELWWQKSES